MTHSITPIVNELNRPYWLGAESGALVLPHCSSTNRPFWPPSPISPFAYGVNVEWREVKPDGIIVAVVVYRRGFLKSFEPLLPFGIALVEVASQTRLYAFVRDPLSKGAPKAGLRALLSFERISPEGVPVLTASAEGNPT